MTTEQSDQTARPGAGNATAPITRRTAWFLLVVAGWMVFVWGTFIRNLARDDGRPTGFYVAHGVLIVVDLAIAVVIGVIAVRALRATRPAG